MRFLALSAIALASLVVNAQEDPAASESVVTTTTSVTTDPGNSASLVDPSGTLSLTSESSSSAAASTTGTKKSSTKSSSSAAAAATDSAAGSNVAPVSIPSGISSGCSSALNALNTDAALAKCLSPYYSASSAFSSATGDKSTVSAALNKVCSASGCATTIRSLLASTNSACKDELSGSNPNTDVREIYDYLYIVYPMYQSICAKDSGSYCALTAASSNSAQVSDYKQSVLGGGDGVSSFSKDGVPYLFATPSMEAKDLCTPCTQTILGYYASWESSTAHAFGVLNSPTLGGQKELLNAVNTQCGSTYLQTIKNSVETPTNGAAHMRSGFIGGAATILVGAVGAWIML